MKKVIKQVVVFLLISIMTLSLVACSEPEDSVVNTDSNEVSEAEDSTEEVKEVKEEENEEIVITLWHSAYTSSAELEMPEEEWEINKLIKRFEEANPGINIEGTYISDQTVLQSKLKAAVAAGEAPDIVNIFTGYTPTSLKDILLDITQYVPEEDLTNIGGWQSVSEELVLGNPILGYPSAGTEMGCLVYNKKLVAAAGVDLEGDGKPKTAQEFADAMKKIKETGIIPIIGSDGGYNAAFMFSFGSWWTQQVGTEGVTSNSLAKTKFVDDKAFIDSLNFVSQMYKDGLINKDYATNADPSAEFYSGKAAMLITGNWEVQNSIDILGDDAGFYVVPNFKDGVKYENAKIGGVGQALSVINTTKYPEEAVKFLSFFNNKENTIIFTKTLSKIPNRVDVSADEIGWSGNSIFEKLLAESKVNLFAWNDNSMKTEVMNEYYPLSGLVVVGKMTAEEVAIELDKVAAKANQ